MTKRSKTFFFTLLVFLYSVSPLSADTNTWVIAAQKFIPDNVSEKESVNSKTAELIPSDILEKIGTSIIRNVYPEEQFERQKYKLRTERQALFLQLSAEYKKRDSLVLNNYSELQLKSAYRESQKKIDAIQKKIDDNLKALKEASEENEKKIAELEKDKNENESKNSEASRFKNLLENIFVKDVDLIQQEQIKFYKDDTTALYKPSAEIAKLELTDSLYEKNIISAGIDSLITGHFAKYGDYISIYVDLYSYPGAKKIGSVAEVGSTKELEYITTSIAMQLIPIISNSLPVQLEITMTPPEAADSAVIYMDEVIQKTENGKIIVDSGIHTIQFISEGYKTAGTTYAFEGNKKYKINVNFEKPDTGFLQIGLRNNIEGGDILVNGEHALSIESRKSQIQINGKEILGEFIAENGETAFFYIPKKLIFDGSYVTIKPKPMDRMSYIDKRRKIMYTSYSIFVLSLIPAFYTTSTYQNQMNLYSKNQTDYQTAKAWQTSSRISLALTIGCGLFWGYELIRYLIAANSVLPQKAKPGDPMEFIYYDPITVPETVNSSTENSDEKIDDNGDNKK